MPAVANIDDAFWPLFVGDAHAWKTDPRDLAAIMMAESGLNPHVTNGIGCVGMNQLCPVNHKLFAPLSPAQYAALDASTQWKAGAGKFLFSQIVNHPDAAGNLGRLYWLNWKPALYKPNTPDNAFILDFDGSPTKVDPGDGGLVLPEDRATMFVRPRGLAAFAHHATQGQNAPRWKSILSAIDAAEQGEPLATPGKTPPPKAPSAGVLAAGASGGDGAVILFGVALFIGWRALRGRH